MADKPSELNAQRAATRALLTPILPALERAQRDASPPEPGAAAARRDAPLHADFTAAWSPRDADPALGPLSASEAAALWEQGGTLERFLDEAPESQVDAARRWAQEWPHLDERASMAAGRTLAAWAICARKGEPNPSALRRLLERFDAEDLATLEVLGCDTLAALAVLRTSELPSDADARAPRADDAPAVLRLLVRHHAAQASPGDVERLAPRLRGALLRALDRDDAIPQAFTDTAELAPAWDRLDASAALSDDNTFIRMYYSKSFHPGLQAEEIARAIAALPQEDAEALAKRVGGAATDTPNDADADGEPHSVMAPIGVAAFLEALRRRVRLTPDREAIEGDASQALVRVTATKLSALPWTWLLGLSLREHLGDEIDELLETELETAEDWFDFDAPGEGELPSVWAAALALAGQLSEERAEALDADLDAPDAGLEEGVPSADAAARRAAHHLSETTSPATASGARLDGLGSPMSSYSVGLHEAVAEAYGDVYSPADPFSTRPARERSKDER